MSEKVIIEPQSHSAVGKVPRNLMVGGLLLFTVVGMTWYAMNDNQPKHITEKEQIQTRLKQAADTGTQGNPVLIDEAERAAQSAKRDRDRREQAEARSAAASAASVAGLPFNQPGANQTAAATPAPGQPLPNGGIYSGIPRPLSQQQQQSTIDAGEAERERSTREAKAVVFDRSGESDAGSVAGSLAKVDPQLAQLAQLAQLDPRREQAGGADNGAQAALLELAKAQSGAGRGESRQAAQSKWLNTVNAGAKAGQQEVITPMAPPGRYMVRVGRFIPAVLTREITSEAEGVVTARASENVYDSQGNLMIPMGSVFVGRYNSNVAFGQSRMAAAFTQLRLPNGYTFALPGAETSDALGRGGVTGDVDRHYVQSFGAALLMGVIADRVSQANKVPNTTSGTSTGSSGLSATGQVFVDSARVELERAKGIAPTITVPAGARINVEVVRDMLFPGPYKTWSQQ